MSRAKIPTLIATIVLLMAFTSDSERVLEFKYPKEKDAAFSMTTHLFKKFEKEWRGEDYYYYLDEDKGGLICSVLFYKLNDDELKALVDLPKKRMNGPETSPAYPSAYFTAHSNLSKYESNKAQWGDPASDFMFSHADVKEFNGMKVNQKHMYGYAMFGKDLFVNIHLSKVNCTAGDSITMRRILDSLTKNR